MWPEFSVHNFFPFLFIFISIWLSWDKMFCLMPYPCAPINKKSKCCMVGNHLHRILHPRWNFLYLVSACWTYNVPSRTQETCSRQRRFLIQGVLHMQHWPTWKTSLGCMLPYYFNHPFFFKYYNTCLKFSLSSLVILVTLVHRNYMAGSMLGFPPFSTHSNFSTTECRMSASFFYSLLELSYMFYRPFLSSDDNFALSSSSKNQLIP